MRDCENEEDIMASVNEVFSFDNHTLVSPLTGNSTNWANETFIEHGFFRQFKKVYAPYHGYLSLFVCIFGIITNVLNIVVLTQ